MTDANEMNELCERRMAHTDLSGYIEVEPGGGWYINGAGSLTELDAWGIIPRFLYIDSRTGGDAWEQLLAAYPGNEFKGHTVHFHWDDDDDAREGYPPEVSLSYPGDPVTPEISRWYYGGQLIVLFQYAWVMVMDGDLSYHIMRMD